MTRARITQEQQTLANQDTNDTPRKTSIEFDTQAVHKFKRVYLKDLSFESPNAPAVFAEKAKHQKMNVNVRVAHTPQDNNVYEVAIRLTVQAFDRDDKTICLIEVEQAGLFDFSAVSDQNLNDYLKIHCPRALYPFARRHIWSLIYEGSFPNLLLQDFDFEAMQQIVSGGE